MKKLSGLLFLAAVLFASCERQEQPTIQGKAVKFITSAVSVNTKTSYKGEAQNGIEDILWDDGDTFTVWSDQASVAGASQKWADYKVKAEGGAATAVYPGREGVELLWGEGLHQFYALYPAGEMDGSRLCANIPNFQHTIEAEGNVFLPNLSEYGYMAASAETNPSEAPVKLLFTPMFSTLEFTVSAGPDAQVDVTGFRLTSGEGSKQVLAGDFNAVLAPNADLDVDIDYTNTSGEIRVSLGDHRKVRLEKGKTMTISVVTLPVNLSHLTAIFTVNSKDVQIPLVDSDGNYLCFPAGEKARINALGVLEPEAQPATFTVAIRGHRVTEYTVSKPGGNNVLLPGVFTVGDKKVRFSKGNLQAVLENGVITKWQFAQHQWETGRDVWSLTNETGTVGLFLNSTTAPLNRWGTHSLDFSVIEGGIDGAYATITPEAEQLSNNYYIGNAAPQFENTDFAQTFGSGWNFANYDALLATYDRREYHVHGHYTDYYIPHCTPAKVEDINGVIAFPEDYVQPAAIPVFLPDIITYDSGGSGLTGTSVIKVNEYDSSQWSQMERAGAVFLPAGNYNLEPVDITLHSILSHNSGSTRHFVIVSDGKTLGYTISAHGTTLPGIIRFVQVVE
ncbi:MAG: fimbrillin family protein [Bacteroidales bacterium]|nr:fimbrillin family protein [Bacteroidales bacterium]